MKHYEDVLMRLPNVTGVGLGERAERPVIVVFVTQKVAESALRPEDVVPKALGGYQTDVEEVGAITAQDAPPREE